MIQYWIFWREKKIRIVVWYGLEEKIPDILASQIIEEVIRPEVKKGNFYEAVKKFYEKFGFVKRIDADLGYGMILTDN